MEKFLFKLKLFRSFQILTIFVRYLLGIAFVWASILKIRGIRFEPESGENTPINSTSHLLEAMYRSGFYWYFIGWGQFIAGLLIMSQIFSTLWSRCVFPNYAKHFYSYYSFSVIWDFDCDVFNASREYLLVIVGLE
jgi:hypothetical protein